MYGGRGGRGGRPDHRVHCFPRLEPLSPVLVVMDFGLVGKWVMMQVAKK